MENSNYMWPILKDARLKSKLTQDEAAERAGITTRYLMTIENEGKCLALDVGFRLIRSLHISSQPMTLSIRKTQRKRNRMGCCSTVPTNSRLIELTDVAFRTS